MCSHPHLPCALTHGNGEENISLQHVFNANTSSSHRKVRRQSASAFMWC